MAYQGDIYQYDVGKIFRVDTGEDLSNATYYRLEVIGSTGETGVVVTRYWIPTVTSGQTEYNETEGQTVLEYTTVEGDLDYPGKFKIVAYVEWTSSVRLRGKPAVIVVKEVGEE